MFINESDLAITRKNKMMLDRKTRAKMKMKMNESIGSAAARKKDGRERKDDKSTLERFI
jgi:hypothetical protein